MKINKAVMEKKLETARLKWTVDAYMGIQKARIQTSNRIDMFVRDFKLKKKEAQHEHELMDKQLKQVETNISKQFLLLVRKYPIYERLSAVRGIGPGLSAQLISAMETPERFETIAKLWKYAGLATETRCRKCEKRIFNTIEERNTWIKKMDMRMKNREKKAKFVPENYICICQERQPYTTSQRRRRGELLDYNPFLKMLSFKIASQFVKQGKYYRMWYDKFKKMEEDKNKKLGKKQKLIKGHIHARAMRKVAKVFLSQVYLTWMELLGKPYRSPYAQDKLQHKIDPFLPIETKLKKEDIL